MTRREQIDTEAMGRFMYVNSPIPEEAKAYYNARHAAFVAGAEYADSTNVVTEINLHIQKENSTLKSQLAIAVEALKSLSTITIENRCDGCGLNAMLIDEPEIAVKALAKIEAKRHQEISKVLDEDDRVIR